MESLLCAGAHGPSASFRSPLLISRLWAFARHAGLADRTCLMPRSRPACLRAHLWKGLPSTRGECCPAGHRGNVPSLRYHLSRVGESSFHSSDSGWKTVFFRGSPPTRTFPSANPSDRLRGSQPGDTEARVTAIGAQGQAGRPTWADSHVLLLPARRLCAPLGPGVFQACSVLSF